MDEKTILLNFTSKIFNLSEDKLIELIYDKNGEGDDATFELKKDALKLLKAQDVTRIDGLKQADSGKFEEGHKKATAEVMGKFEKAFKEKSGYSSDLQGVDLIMDWGASLKSTDNLTDDQLKVTPAWLAAEKKTSEVHKTELQTEKDRFVTYETEVKQDKMLGVVKSAANTIFDAAKPILPKSPIIATNQKTLFLNQVTNGYNFTVDGNNVSAILVGDKRLEDGHGNNVQFDDFVKGKIGELYEIPTGGGAGGNAGNDNDGAGGNITVNVPRSKEEYNKMIGEAANDDKKIQAIGLAWKESDAYKASQGV